ncbi:hypothetical protein [Bradyrhizobium diazoefficiens]|uniref:hypothetical protein n=1 Tax=Bradyrhizobium diazoefficiens TaxID=1355477 RepID=UPI002714C6BA|nr:hypothetical protein [Bradyrhizobium diazoefficiens]WLB38000.1 hypothetical protein QIH78_42815 [Bradyrhizobium diazoefficiens]WLC17115.1 hypothetical protein QIH76_01470 [Bradyrhizobium diazoefficiens]
MKSSDRIDLARAAGVAVRSSTLIGGLFPPWERAFSGSVAEFLGADQRGMTSLALCMRPKPDHFAVDVAEIAAACRIDENRLAAWLRQAMSVEAMAAAPPASGAVDGRLMAARDRTEDDE